MDTKLTASESFVNRINSLMTKNRINQSLQDRAKILKDLCGVSVQAARKWLEGENMPDCDKLMLISNRFSVTVSYLIGEIDEKNAVSTDNKGQLKRLFGKGFIVDLDDEQMENTIINGDSVFCVPIEKDEKINGYIYLLKIGDNTVFRILSLDGSQLISIYEKNGVEIKDVYDDPKVIDLLLSSVVARVKKVVKEEKQYILK